MTMPNAPAVKTDSTTSLRLQPFSLYIGIRHPGRMPQLPAVGVATILPMAALQSETAMQSETASAVATARLIKVPIREFPLSAYRIMALPSPPVRPDVERRPGSCPQAADSSITSKLFSIRAKTSSAGRPVSFA